LEQYIEEIRPDSTKKEVIEFLREFFSDTTNFVHRQVLQISALHILLREVLFAYGAVKKPVGGGYIPSRLIKVLMPDKDEYAFLLMCFAKHERRSAAILVWTTRICKEESAKKRTAHKERGRLIGMTRYYSYTKHQRMKKPAPCAELFALCRHYSWRQSPTPAGYAATCNQAQRDPALRLPVHRVFKRREVSVLDTSQR
jgi:hypothetical protein